MPLGVGIRAMVEHVSTTLIVYSELTKMLKPEKMVSILNVIILAPLIDDDNTLVHG